MVKLHSYQVGLMYVTEIKSPGSRCNDTLHLKDKPLLVNVLYTKQIFFFKIVIDLLKRFLHLKMLNSAPKLHKLYA
jgi:hypothetical protein